MKTVQVVLVLFAVFGVAATAGCPAATENGTSPTVTNPNTSPTVSDVSNTTAKERALAAEENCLREWLQNESYQEWGLTETTVQERATILNRTAEGVYVEVQHPFWYATENSVADLGSNATYLVNTDRTTRVEGEFC